MGAESRPLSGSSPRNSVDVISGDLSLSGKNMRVMVLTRMWPTSERPHDGTFVKDEIEALQRNGVQCRVVAQLGPGGARCYVRLWRKMRRALKEGDFDVVHAHYGTTGWVGRGQRSAPLVVTFHGSDLMGGRLNGKGRESVMGYIEILLGRALTRLIPNVIVVSSAMLKRTPLGRARVIPAGVDLMQFRPASRNIARQVLGITDDHPVMLFVADPELINKRFDLASAAHKIAVRVIPDLRLVSITNRPHDELPLWMNAADVLVFTSNVEGSPMVIKEALACNLPVVSVDVGDVAERLKGVSGCRLVERSPIAIAEGLIGVIKTGEPCNGRDFAAHFSNDQSAEKVIQVYRAAIRRSGPKHQKRPAMRARMPR